MNEIEKRLAEEKERMEKLLAPPELENRLRAAIEQTKRPKQTRRLWMSIAVAAMLFVTIGYNFNAVAYYGKKVFGFDEVLSDTLQELNEGGFGQIIEKTYSLEDGVKFTIDAVINDENRFILFYTISDPNGIKEDPYNNLISAENITGLFTNSYMESGVERFDGESKEYKGTWDFEPVSPFSKKLTLHLTYNTIEGKITQHELNFSYDPNQALQTQLKLPINKTVKVDKGTIKFKSLIATPTETVVSGSMDVDNYDRLHGAIDGIKLVVNGQNVESLGGGSGTTWTGGHYFEINYDALPSAVDSLTLQVEKFVGYKKLKQRIALQTLSDAPINIGGKSLWIEGVTSTDKQTEITIVTASDILLDEVYIENTQGKTPIKTTIGQTEIEKEGKYFNKRTMLFPTGKAPTHLYIGGIHYMKKYNQTIEIPVK